MATPIIDHNLLTLDYWQDSVTYEGKTIPGGTIGCEALNIPDTLRKKLAQASIPLQKIVAAIKENNLTAELRRPAKGSVLQMIQLAKDTPPFSRADAVYYSGRVEHIFSEEGIQNTLAYVQAAAVVGLLATFNEQFRQDVGITKINYRINRRPGKLPHVSDNAIDWERYIENRKSSVRCKVEHAFRIIKCQFGYKKTVYRGLKKNENRLYAMFACANLYALAIAGRKLSTT